MRRDIFKYYNNDVVNVFNAYLQSAEHYYPGRVTALRYHTISFSLNYSWKYNMNGGALHMHFIRYNSGTAVEFRYSLVQLAGARYAAHEQTISKEAAKYIGETGNYIKGVRAELFSDPQFIVNDTGNGAPVMQSPPTPQPGPIPQGAPIPMPGGAPQDVPGQPGAMPQGVPKFCRQCGFALNPQSVFCSGCGARVR